MRETAIKNEFFLTELLRNAVLDKNGKDIGILTDLVVGAYGETFPKVTALEVKSGNKLTFYSREDVDLLSQRIVTLRVPKERASPRQADPNDLFLAKDFLDKQILDIHGAKVVRLNDLKLAALQGEFRLIAGDVGFLGLLRRLNLERPAVNLMSAFGKRFAEHLIPWNFVEPISSRDPSVKLTVPQSKITQLHPADIAEILKDLAPPERAMVMESLDKKAAAEALHDVEPELGLEILDDLPSDKAASILEEMKLDDAADILVELPEEERSHILSGLRAKEALDLKELISHHDEDTAGGLMTSEYISLSQELTAEQTINRLRELAPEAEIIYYLYVVDSDDHLQGIVNLRDLIVAKPDTPLKSIMTIKIVKVPPTAKKEKVADLIAKYDLLAIPVVDRSEKLVGIVTVDDAMDVVRAQRQRRRKGFAG